MNGFSDIYKNRRVLVTGHTGFKGTWLSYWLASLGANLAGIALAPQTEPNHWSLVAPDIESHIQDIRNGDAISEIIRNFKPEIVFHLAAQPIVHRSYRDPLETYSTNIMGTAHLLEACRNTPSVEAIVSVTSDKCYENVERSSGYHEDDRLGGHDPYSASKACAELVVASYRKSFFSAANAPLVATVRAGNVIGGGDWSENRLIPDIVRATVDGKPILIRSPNATRPWQHVLEPLSGYLELGKKLLQGKPEYASAWNFGPDSDCNRPVLTVLEYMKKNWPGVNWQIDQTDMPHEATLLHLDSTKARSNLSWQPVWNLEECLAATAQWYRSYYEDGETITAQQVKDYNDAAQTAALGWAA